MTYLLKKKIKILFSLLFLIIRRDWHINSYSLHITCLDCKHFFDLKIFNILEVIPAEIFISLLSLLLLL